MGSVGKGVVRWTCSRRCRRARRSCISRTTRGHNLSASRQLVWFHVQEERPAARPVRAALRRLGLAFQEWLIERYPSSQAPPERNLAGHRPARRQAGDAPQRDELGKLHAAHRQDGLRQRRQRAHAPATSLRKRASRSPHRRNSKPLRWGDSQDARRRQRLGRDRPGEGFDKLGDLKRPTLPSGPSACTERRSPSGRKGLSG